MSPRRGRPAVGGPGLLPDTAVQLHVYRGLAVIDPPVLRSLIVELTRISEESAASAVQAGTAEAAARAYRNAQQGELGYSVAEQI